MAFFIVDDTDKDLYHHGIKGQKWGVRRFQNENGSLTAAGKSRYRDTKGNLTSEGKAADRSLGVKKSTATDVSKGTQTVTNITKANTRLIDFSENKRRQSIEDSIDTSKLTNKEMQDAITRLNLERSYKSLMTDQIMRENVNVGKTYARDIFEVAGDVLVIGASAASIAATIYSIKKGLL